MATIKFGALVFQYQAIDVVGPIDILNGASKFIQTAINSYTPIDEKVIAAAPNFEFYHIGETLDPVPLMSSGLVLKPTITLDDCPPLDILPVGGADPASFELSSTFADFIRRHVVKGGMLWTTCTGSAMVASTRVLDGRRATINNQEFGWVKEKYPKVNWTKEKKWIVDGKIWTSSGAVAGMDMTAFWLERDFEPRDVDGVQNVLPKRHDANGRQISTRIY